MGRNICIVTVFLAAGSVLAEYNENLACCPQSTFILADKSTPIHFILSNKTQCYDPEKNITSTMKLPCEGVYMPFDHFTVNSGMIDFHMSDGLTFSYDSDMTCYGNVTEDRSMLNITSLSLVCISEEEVYFDEEGIYEKCLIVSAVCLSATTVIYAIFAELRNLFGKSVINFCGSMAIGMGIMGSMSMVILEDNYSKISCALRGFSAYYFMMASFFWSNSLSIQVLIDSRRPVAVDYGWREFRWYMLYSWGCPAVLTVIAAIVNYHPGNHQKPGLGLNRCWFVSEKQLWYYMHSVMTILLVINFAILIYIATTLWRFAFKSTHVKTVRYRLMMTIRLIVLAGLPWVIELVRSAIRARSYAWFVVDLVTALHGLLIFLVLVVRKRVVRVLQQRGLLACCTAPVESWLEKGDEECSAVHNDVSLHEDSATDQVI